MEKKQKRRITAGRVSNMLVIDHFMTSNSSSLTSIIIDEHFTIIDDFTIINPILVKLAFFCLI